MKKIIALLLAALMLFSLTACGGESGKLKEKDLINIEWYGVLNHTSKGPSYIKFEKDGIGSYVYYENGNDITPFTWSIVENTIKVVTQSTDMFGSNTFESTLEYVKDETGVQLKRNDSNSIYVPKENFETATETLKEKFISEAVILDWDSAVDLNLENEVKFKNEYIGKIYKYTAKVYEINERYCSVANETYMGLPCNSVYVYLSSEELAQISKYSTITVIGTLSSYSINGTISNAFLVEE